MLDINGSFLKSCLKSICNTKSSHYSPEYDCDKQPLTLIFLDLIVLHSLEKMCRYGYFISDNTIKIINTMIVRIIHTVHCSRQESASQC